MLSQIEKNFASKLKLIAVLNHITKQIYFDLKTKIYLVFLAPGGDGNELSKLIAFNELVKFKAFGLVVAAF